MKRWLSITLLLPLLCATSLQAQQRGVPRFQKAAGAPASLAPVFLAAAPGSPPAIRLRAQQEEAGARNGGLSLRTVAHVIGGAVIGGWLGYVGAQLVRSDWDEETDGSFRGQRTAWVVGGAVVGILGSRLIGSSRSPRSRPIPVRAPPRDGMSIGLEEIRGAAVQTAFELIRSLRSDWLIPRGYTSPAETAAGGSQGFQGREMIIVYLDDVRLGGVETMREIPIDFLTGAEFIEPARATYRYGPGHTHGVIRLLTGNPG